MGTYIYLTSPGPSCISTALCHLSPILESPNTATTLLSTSLPAADLLSISRLLYATAINPIHQPVPIGSQAQAWRSCHSQEGAGLPLFHGHPGSLLPTSLGWTVLL